MRALRVLLLCLLVGTSASAQPILIDHTTDLALFDQIPQETLQIIQQTAIEFADRSVGANVWDAFRLCLPPGFAGAPSSCRTKRAHVDGLPDLPDQTWSPMTFGVTFNGWPNLGLPNEMAGCPTDGTWLTMWPCYRWWIDARKGSYKVFGLFPDYTMGEFSATSPLANFYTDLSGTNDAVDMLAWAQGLGQDQRMVWFTPSVPKGETTPGQLQRLNAAATAARTFALEHNQVLIDVYDLVTRGWVNGEQALNANGIPIQHRDWGSEANGGHLTYGQAKVRMAKYWVIGYALALGWTPDAPVPSSTDTTPPTVALACDPPSILARPTKMVCTVTFADDGGLSAIRIGDLFAVDPSGNVLPSGSGVVLP